MSVAILGTGRLGHGFAEAFCVRRMPVTVWNRTPERARDLAEKGATVAPSAEDAIRAADVVICTLVSEKAIMEVLSSLEGRRPLAGRAWVNLTSTPSAGARRLQEATRQAGSESFVDLATTTLPGDLIEGKGLMQLGCASDDVARWTSFFAPFGTVDHTGDVGSASVFEMAHGLPLFMAHHAYLEAVALLDRNGLRSSDFSGIFVPPALVSSRLFPKLDGYVRERTFLPALMTVGHYVHVLGMIIDELEAAGADTVSWRAALGCAERAAARGPDRDWSCVYEIMME